MIQNINQSLLTQGVFTATTTGSSFGLDKASLCAIQSSYSVSSGAVKTVPDTDVNVGTSTFTKTAHGYTTGLPVVLTTDDTLPAPLALLTTYYIISLTANTFKVASSYTNAVAGTAITLVDDGTGTTTFTPTAGVGSLQYQSSNDNINWTNEGSAIAISAAGSTMTKLVDVGYNRVRAVYTHTSGNVTLKVLASAKG